MNLGITSDNPILESRSDTIPCPPPDDSFDEEFDAGFAEHFAALMLPSLFDDFDADDIPTVNMSVEMPDA